jgi:hypothetical protein
VGLDAGQRDDPAVLVGSDRFDAPSLAAHADLMTGPDRERRFLHRMSANRSQKLRALASGDG